MMNQQIHIGNQGTRTRLQNKRIVIARTIALLLLGGLLILSFIRVENKPEDTYEDYLAAYGKQYEENEKAFRLYLKIRKEKEVKSHNADPNSQYTKAINEFSDLTQQEFEELYMTMNQVRMIKKIPLDQFEPGHSSHLNISWSQFLPPVKNQGRCKAPYAFATVGVVEAVFNIQANKSKQNLLSLSEQQIIDCCQKCSGCDSNETSMGKDLTQALQYIINIGVQKQQDYPWKQKKGQCKKVQSPGNKIIDYTKGNKMATLLRMLDKGPVIVTVDARNWRDYQQGVFSNCGRQMNHQALLVGRTPEYFLIRNSWGRRWGEKGYIKLAMGFTCGIFYNTYSPII